VLSEAGISESQSVLDFGCGSGTYSIPAAKLVGKKGKIYSLDVSQKALENLKRKAKNEDLNNIVTILSSGNVEIQIDDNTLDHVLLIDVLQEISKKEILLEETHRILKPDGMMTIYPMHIDADEIIKLTSSMNYRLKKKIFQEQILIFEKS
jgi:ubiquinone/menaquinone biosynthesis C-methylase UbiE